MHEFAETQKRFLSLLFAAAQRTVQRLSLEPQFYL